MLIDFLKKTKLRFEENVIPFFKMLFYNTFCKGWIIMFGHCDRRQLKYRISICLIFKNEAPFLKEWLDFHLTIGVDHFYLYNNNSEDNYKDVLAPYLAEGKVTLIDFPYQAAQMRAYKECFEKFRSESKWIAFLDADEFLCPKRETDINSWIKQFDKYPAVVVRWLMFGTGGIVEHDRNLGVIEQYKICHSLLHDYGKCFVNTKYDIAEYNWHTHHLTYMKYPILGRYMVIPAVNQFKHILPINFPSKLMTCRKEEASIQINHYYTKAWNLFKEKMNRTDVYYKKQYKTNIDKFYKVEDGCISSDFSILRFLIRKKIYLNDK